MPRKSSITMQNFFDSIKNLPNNNINYNNINYRTILEMLKNIQELLDCKKLENMV